MSKKTTLTIIVLVVSLLVAYFFIKIAIDTRDYNERTKHIKIEPVVTKTIDCTVDLSSNFFENNAKTFHTKQSSTVAESYYFLKAKNGQYYLRNYTPSFGQLVIDYKVNVHEDVNLISITYCNEDFMNGEYFEYLKKDNIFLIYNKDGKIFSNGNLMRR